MMQIYEIFQTREKEQFYEWFGFDGKEWWRFDITEHFGSLGAVLSINSCFSLKNITIKYSTFQHMPTSYHWLKEICGLFGFNLPIEQSKKNVPNECPFWEQLKLEEIISRENVVVK